MFCIVKLVKTGRVLLVDINWVKKLSIENVLNSGIADRKKKYTVFYTNDENAKAKFTDNMIDDDIFVEKSGCYIANVLAFFGKYKPHDVYCVYFAPFNFFYCSFYTLFLYSVEKEHAAKYAASLDEKYLRTVQIKLEKDVKNKDRAIKIGFDTFRDRVQDLTAADIEIMQDTIDLRLNISNQSAVAIENNNNFGSFA